MLTRFRERVRTGFGSLRAAVTTTSEQGWTPTSGLGSVFRFLPGAAYDYRREAGNLWDNSIVLACIKWQGRVFPEAPGIVERKQEDGVWQKVPDHPLERLADDPNPWYDGCVLWQGTLLSLAVDGNAYWRKLYSGAGKVVGYQYVPHYRLRPFHSKGDPNFLSGYLYWPGTGAPIPWPADSVVHFRDGYHPENDLLGLSPLGAVLREVCTDNEASTFAAALLRNMGVPGVLIAPKGGPEIMLTRDQIDQFRTQWEERFTGEGRGKPFIQGIPIDVQMPGFSPEQLTLEKVRDIAEERITAALGIPAVVVGFGSGLDNATNRATVEEMQSWAWRNNIIPTQRIIAGQLTRGARRDGLLQPNERFAFDTNNVAALQEDQNELYKRLTLACGRPFMTVNEAREKAGLTGSLEGGDELALPMPALPPGGEDEEGDTPGGSAAIVPVKPQSGAPGGAVRVTP